LHKQIAEAKLLLYPSIKISAVMYATRHMVFLKKTICLVLSFDSFIELYFIDERIYHHKPYEEVIDTIYMAACGCYGIEYVGGLRQSENR